MSWSKFSVADPLVGNGLVTEGLLNDLAVAEQAVMIALTDTVDLFGLPCIRYVGDVMGAGSAVLRSRIMSLGWNLSMSATAAEDTDVSASSVSGDYDDVTVARRAVRLDQTGLAQIVGGAWGFDPLQLALTLVDSFKAGRMDALASAVAGASTNITSADTGSMDDILDVIDTFAGNGYTGNLYGYIKPFTMASIRDSIRSEVGPFQYRGDLQRLLAIGAEMLLGIASFGDNRVTDAAGKYENAIMADSAVLYGIGSTSRVIANVGAIRPAGMPMVIDLEKNSSSDTLEINANGYDGLALGEAKRTVGLLAANS